MMSEFLYQSTIDGSAEDVFRWHTRKGAFERLNPPWDPVEVIERTGGIRDGDRVKVRMRLGPIPIDWTIEHRDYIEGRQFRDVQIHGPFSRWEHTHRIEPAGTDRCILKDEISYELPLGAMGRALGEHYTRDQLQRLFAYRHELTQRDVSEHKNARQGNAVSSMTILVSGASGLVGSSLTPLLSTGGHNVKRLVRSIVAGDDQAVLWNPESGVSNPGDLAGVDAVVHLAGESIASGRWSAAKKRRIRESRVVGTRRLCETLIGFDRPPQTLVCASAIGFYGDCGDRVVDESTNRGRGFLADVCEWWEAAAEIAHKAGIRVVNARFGVILSPRGGALAKMLTPFRLGGGGVLGSGCQYMSWIGIDDVVRGILHCLVNDELNGPVNFVAPSPVTNREFTKTLGRVLRRPTILPMPAAAVRLAFGEMADELLLSSTRAEPKRLTESGFRFQDQTLEACLRRLLGKIS